MFSLVVILSLSIRVGAQTCQGVAQYDRCSSNPSCGCLPMMNATNEGTCAYLHVTCSGLVSCSDNNWRCFQPGYVCILHPRCQSLPVCYPVRMASSALCPPIHQTTTPSPDEICADATWSQNGVTVAGGNGQGDALNQLSAPIGIFIDNDNSSIYVADQLNNRIMKWASADGSGLVVAGGKGAGNHSDMLSEPLSLVIDKNGTMIICDYGNDRIVRWPQGASSGEIFISNISCVGLTLENDEFLYVTQYQEHRVTRWDLRRPTNGQVVAGGHGAGSALNQLNMPYYLFVDRDRSVFVVDHGNNRVMKWTEGVQEGILVAGDNGVGNSSNQLYLPCSVIVDQLGSVYVTDIYNHRVMRYLNGSKDGIVIVGGHGPGDASDQLNQPYDLSFDRNGNLYVVDQNNGRVQMFKINTSACRGKFV